MTCKEIQQNLPAFEDGDLAPALQAVVQQHLDTCDACVGELAAMDQAWAMLDSVPPPTMEVAQDFNHRFWKRVEAEPVGWWARLRDSVHMPVRALAVFSVMLVLMAHMFSTVAPPAGVDPPLAPQTEAQYDVLGDVDVVPDLSELDVPASPQPAHPQSAADDKIDRILQEMPLDGGPQG